MRRRGAGLLRDDPPPAEHQPRGHSLNAETARDERVVVDVDLDELDSTGEVLGQTGKYRADHPAWPAPRRPQVHDHRNGRLFSHLGERRVSCVNDPGQRFMALTTARYAFGNVGNAIATTAIRASDDGRRNGRAHTSTVPFPSR